MFTHSVYQGLERAGSPREVYTSPTVSKPVTVSMFEPQSHHGAALAQNWKTNKQTLAMIRVALFGPPAACKRLKSVQEALAYISLKGALEEHLDREACGTLVGSGFSFKSITELQGPQESVREGGHSEGFECSNIWSV
ncbi:hypothetical protein Q5P01_001066 [Channa striata]|uniref:Uncharacterized protein n=1 Tax=Channa striata TaxID=64152 RepID=A0AA88NY85_CHASR|nr:hypothetical protein Q5P01_001066 [Channa striata]